MPPNACSLSPRSIHIAAERASGSRCMNAIVNDRRNTMDTKAQKKLFDALRAVDTPTICNALEEARGFRTATGFTTQHMHPTEPDAPPIVGYARTGIIRAAQPAVGAAAEKKARRVGWYEYVVSGEGPTVAVIQDLDSNPGTGAMWGEVNSTVHRGLGVLGCVTNGSVRDLTVLAKG